MFSNICSLISRENDENCVVDNMSTVFWFNKQNEFENSIYLGWIQNALRTVKTFMAPLVPVYI